MSKEFATPADVIQYLQNYAAKRLAAKNQNNIRIAEHTEPQIQLQHIEKRIEILEQQENQKIIYFADALCGAIHL